MNSPSVLQMPTSRSALFDLWAETYDDENNPLLMLEERTLEPLLPTLKGAHVLDAGCGTGRLLRRFEGRGTASLVGVDPSTAMLERASHKLAEQTTLIRSVCTALPAGDDACDLVTSSFVLAYVDDIETFAGECARVLKPGGLVLLSDMHPATAAERQWTRGFTHQGSHVNLCAALHTLAEIREAFEREGFALSALEEPSFGLPERTSFAQAGKLLEFDNLLCIPAIYLMKLRKRTRLQLVGACWSTGPQTWEQHPLTIDEAYIAFPESKVSTAPRLLDLSGYTLLPGLINAHDHLEFALFPNLGRTPAQPAFRNATEWANEIHQVHAETISRHLRVPLHTRLWWGALRNLLCGVTTVCHHNPLHAELTAADFPVRVLAEFSWAHSLAFDIQLVQKFRERLQDRPFILHAAEGADETSRNEFYELERMNILSNQTVLVHALALSASEITRLNECDAAVIVCPTSNRFLFGQTMSAEVFSTIQRSALGSDSPLTAAGDLLDEIRFLADVERVAPEALYKLVTSGASNVLQLRHGEGHLCVAGRADLIAVRDAHCSPAATLAKLSMSDIELVLVGGTIQLVSSVLYERLPIDLRDGLHLLAIAGVLRWVRAPLPYLFRETKEHLGEDHLRLGGKEVHFVSAH